MNTLHSLHTTALYQSLARMITANWGIEIKLPLSALVLKNNSQMPDPEWHAGNSATHLVNIKLDFVCYKQAAMNNESTHRELDTEYMSGDVSG